MILVAYITEASGQDLDRHKLDWFYTNDNELTNASRRFWRLPQYREALEVLSLRLKICDRQGGELLP